MYEGQSPSQNWACLRDVAGIRNDAGIIKSMPFEDQQQECGEDRCEHQCEEVKDTRHQHSMEPFLLIVPVVRRRQASPTLNLHSNKCWGVCWLWHYEMPDHIFCVALTPCQIFTRALLQDKIPHSPSSSGYDTLTCKTQLLVCLSASNIQR